ncbi:S-layer homology domain-containing protein [Acetivibrio clariflavus]|uniref:S-layer homology domain-containing protein n=1 Tax=Acetivibrio clariflavus TaxID=288965 RepID=UPI00048626F2|nr:S-layer homology domain-containing protein [Acetivibrio clariflavus]
MLKARQAGYLKGYEGNIAKPESKITREDTSVIVSQVFKLDTSGNNNSLSKFKDAEDISEYAAAAVNKLAADGVIRGYEDGSFKPKANITRAEFIAILDGLVPLLCNAPGTYENKNVSGHVVISNPSVELKNSTIDGNLYITEGIGNAGVTLNKVAVTDTAYISGGGKT